VDAQIDGTKPSPSEFEAAAVVLKMLADPTRLRVLHALLSGERSVNDLAEAVEAQPAAVSQHLAKLRLGHLVATRREGNRIHYSLANDHVERLVREALFEADHLVGGATHHIAESVA
jgi:DNA-binding transcriptional ArsR family regulator